MIDQDLLEQFDGGSDDPIGNVSPEEVDRILLEHWSIRGRTRSLVAERDAILEVLSEDGAHFVLKIYSAGQAVELADLRARATSHISERDPGLTAPKMIKTAGQMQAFARLADGRSRIVQLMTFLKGIPQVDVSRSRKQAFGIGVTLARLAIALRDFHHPADRRNLVWDLANAVKVRSLLPAAISGRWHAPARILDRYREQTSHRLEKLPSQVIHNDFNGHNLLMDPVDPTRIVGIIDFGDVTRSQRVNDLAIAASYQLRLDEPGLSGALDVVTGYHSVSPLRDDEIRLLFDLIQTRLAMAVTITEFRAARLPHRAAQILKNTHYAWRALDHLQGYDPASATSQLFAECNQETTPS
jgi:hydroxylysine kinase